MLPDPGTILLALLLASLLLIVWRKRVQVFGALLMLGSLYLLFTSEAFVVIRMPTLCVVGMGMLAALWLFARPSPRRRKQHQRGQ